MRRGLEAVAAALAALAAMFGACGGTIAAPSDDGPDPDSGKSADVVEAGTADGADAWTAPADASPDGPDPIAACMGARNVFAYAVGSPGPFVVGDHRWTNHDALWSADVEPDVEVEIRVTGGGGHLRIYVPGTQLPAPGTYPQAPQSMPTSPTLQPTFDHQGCTVESGTLTIIDLTTAVDDAGANRLASLVLWFDIQCRFEPAPVPVHGCLRYEASP